MRVILKTIYIFIILGKISISVNQFLKSLLLLCCTVLLNACERKTSENQTNNSIKEVKAEATLALNRENNSTRWKEDFNVKEKIFAYNALGLQMSLDFKVEQQWLDSIKNEGYDAVYVNFSCYTSNTNTLESVKNLPKNQRIAKDKGQFISSARNCKISYCFPYKDLGLEPGIHALKVGYTINGVHFMKEKEPQLTTFLVKKIDAKAIATSTYTTSAASPYLYKVAISVDKFQVESIVHDIHNYDFSLGGSGMPDLYWAVVCGEKIVYFAPQIKNTANYTTPYTSNVFYCCEEDVITINFADYDNGPFNTQDDLIATWQGKVKDLPTQHFDTLRDKKLNYALIKATVIK